MEKRVLIPVSNPLGGIRTYMLYNFRPLHDVGYRFTFLSERGEAFDVFKRDVADWEGTEFIETPPGGGFRTKIREIRRAIDSGVFSLIHSQGLRAGTETSAANLGWSLRQRLPHLVTLHDVIVPQNDIPGRFKGLKRAVISFLVRRASVLIPVTEDCRENHLELFPAWKKGPAEIETIVNGVDVGRLLRSRDEFVKSQNFTLRKENSIESDAVVGGFFGRFMPQKGFDVLLKALRLLSDRGYGDRFRLVATKDLNGYLNETLDKTMRDPAVSRMVRFIDPVSDIAPVLSQMDLLVMPSRWEACGLLAMEAMVLGKPVVGSDCIGLREVLQETPSWAPKHDDAAALAAALIECIEHPRTQAAEAYAAEAAKRFDVAVATEKLLKLYQRFTP